MTTTVDDKTTPRDGPFIRLIQPDQPAAPFTASSYFRLGRYVTHNHEEAQLTSHLKSTRSRVDPGKSPSAPSAATVTSDNIHNVFSMVSQASQDHVTLQDPPIASNNDGILIYTNHDLNETVLGAALQKYGQGHVVDVVDADASYAVQKGKYDLFAQNGIFLYAGSKTNPANIEVVSEANFKLFVKGNSEVNISGKSVKKTVGTTFDHYIGAKCTLFLGVEASIKASGSLTISGGVDVAIRTSGKMSLTLCYDVSITRGSSSSTTIGLKSDKVVGSDSKMVIGTSRKIVEGQDYKITNGDYKLIEGNSSSLVFGRDGKIVEINATICDIDYKKEMAAAADSELKTKKAELTSTFDKITAGQVSVANVMAAELMVFL